MSLIECPSCHKSVQVDSIGIYECPYCNEEFELEDYDVSEEISNLIDGINDGSKKHSIVYQRFPEKISIPFLLICVITSFLIMPLLMLIERIYFVYIYSKRNQRKIIFLHDEKLLLEYQISDYEVSHSREISLNDGFSILSEYEPGSDGAVRSPSYAITIKSESGEEVFFWYSVTDSSTSNIEEFAKFINKEIEAVGPYRNHRNAMGKA